VGFSNPYKDKTDRLYSLLISQVHRRRLRPNHWSTGGHLRSQEHVPDWLAMDNNLVNSLRVCKGRGTIRHFPRNGRHRAVHNDAQRGRPPSPSLDPTMEEESRIRSLRSISASGFRPWSGVGRRRYRNGRAVGMDLLEYGHRHGVLCCR